METTYRADDTVWQGSDIAAGRCTAKDLGRRKPLDIPPPPANLLDAASTSDANGVLPALVTPATIAALVADGSAAALIYLRAILDDSTVPSGLRIKAAQSLLGTLPKQINVSTELTIASSSFDVLMERATALIAGRGGDVAPSVRSRDGNVIDVQAEHDVPAAAD